MNPGLLFIGYLLFGLFLAVVALQLVEDLGEFLFGLFVFAWPLVIGCLVLIGILCIPISLGYLVGKLIKKWLP